MIRNQGPSPTLHHLGLCGPDGDAAAARRFADALLESVSKGLDRRDARLLLTATCLHLQCRQGPDATLEDLVDLLVSCDDGQLSAKLCDGPQSLTDYAVCELGSLESEQRSLAMEMAVSAAKLAQTLL